MKAIVYHRYGSSDVLELAEVDRPAVGDDQVLVRVHASSVNALDWHYMRGKPYIARPSFGLLKPKDGVLGADFAGTVDSVGRNVMQFHAGDEVFGGKFGSLAEYVCVSEGGAVVPKPANLTFEQAAAVPVAASTALQGLRDRGQVQAGQKVLVNGAGGGVGTFIVQIATSLGAEVTAVTSTKNVERIRSVGADHVVDYSVDDFTQSGLRYDLILDIGGNRSMSDLRRAMTPKGTLVIVGGGGGALFGPLAFMVRALVMSRFMSQSVLPFLAETNKKDLLVLKELIEAGKVTPVIDRRYPLSEVPEAIRYLEAGHAQGKLVITLGPDKT
jgi:NADPH:quinone reductase-like Zn-dependent oxidoreductase